MLLAPQSIASSPGELTVVDHMAELGIFAEQDSRVITTLQSILHSSRSPGSPHSCGSDILAD